VLPHGVLVAITQPGTMWRMFGFGFAAIFILTQMHGLGLSIRIRSLLATVFVLAVLVTYGSTGEIGMLHEISRIPVIEFGVVGVLYVLFLIAIRIAPSRHT